MPSHPTLHVLCLSGGVQAAVPLEAGHFHFRHTYASMLALRLLHGRPPSVRQAHQERTLQRLERMKRPGSSSREGRNSIVRL